MALTGPPFAQHHQLCSDFDGVDDADDDSHLRDHPTIDLTDIGGLADLVTEDFWADDLETASHHFWVLATSSSQSIQALHRQKVLAREIVATEEAHLHLLWLNHRIFIKPLPEYLLSYNFWKRYMSDGSPCTQRTGVRVRKAALGFLRTYSHLIRRESDFRIAQQANLRLLPAHITWAQFSAFVTELENIQDCHVSGRYLYGELRLARLNLYAPFLFHRWAYEYIPIQYGEYFARLYGPILFVFALITTILNSMQVTLASRPALEVTDSWLLHVFYWCAIVVLLLTTSIGACLLLIWLVFISDEWSFALKHRRKGLWIGSEAQHHA